MPSGVSDWHLYIVQEYCDGGPLSRAIRSKRFLQGDVLLNILCVALNVASGMTHLHDKQVIHGGSRDAALHAVRAVHLGWSMCTWLHRQVVPGGHAVHAVHVSHADTWPNNGHSPNKPQVT